MIMIKKIALAAICLMPVISWAADMCQYLTDTETMAKAGKHQEALQRFVWMYHNSLKEDPAFAAVRLSYMLAYWKELADKYPPALKELSKIRDDETLLIKEGKGTYITFQEIVAINEILGDDSKSIDLFAFLDKKHPESAKSCWDFVRKKVIAAKNIDLAKKYIKDPGEVYDEIAFLYKANTMRYKNVENMKVFKEINEDVFITDVINLVSLLKMMGNKKLGEEIRQKAIQLLPDSRLSAVGR